MHVTCGMRLTNSLMFILLNWIEIIGFALLFWIIYFSMQIASEKLPANQIDKKETYQYVIFFAI
jgi:hypothetical protein